MKVKIKAYLSKEKFFALPPEKQKEKAKKHEVYKGYLKEGKKASKSKENNKVKVQKNVVVKNSPSKKHDKNNTTERKINEDALFGLLNSGHSSSSGFNDYRNQARKEVKRVIDSKLSNGKSAEEVMNDLRNELPRGKISIQRIHLLDWAEKFLSKRCK